MAVNGVRVAVTFSEVDISATQNTWKIFVFDDITLADGVTMLEPMYTLDVSTLPHMAGGISKLRLFPKRTGAWNTNHRLWPLYYGDIPDTDILPGVYMHDLGSIAQRSPLSVLGNILADNTGTTTRLYDDGNVVVFNLSSSLLPVEGFITHIVLVFKIYAAGQIPLPKMQRDRSYKRHVTNSTLYTSATVRNNVANITGKRCMDFQQFLQRINVSSSKSMSTYWIALSIDLDNH